MCKYVRTPGGDEVLKAGKNPIEISGHSRRATRIPRAVRLMRTISVVLGLVGVILVMTNLRTRTGRTWPSANAR